MILLVLALIILHHIVKTDVLSVLMNEVGVDMVAVAKVLTLTEKGNKRTILRG